MANKPTDTKSGDSKPDANPPAKSTWEFTEEFDLSVAPPAGPVRAPRVTELPFASRFFTPAFPHAVEGKQPHKFIPKAFFTDRADKPEKVDGQYMKGKVRGSYNKWLKALPKEDQEKVNILMIERKGTEEGFPEAGLSVWLTSAVKKG